MLGVGRCVRRDPDRISIINHNTSTTSWSLLLENSDFQLLGADYQYRVGLTAFRLFWFGRWIHWPTFATFCCSMTRSIGILRLKKLPLNFPHACLPFYVMDRENRRLPWLPTISLFIFALVSQCMSVIFGLSRQVSAG